MPELTRRDFAGGLAGAAAWQRGGLRRRPNFLFLIADDHAGYVLGAAGNRRARTPNLDRLAAEGARFSRHFCNSPVCTASRQSFFTGQMPHTAGVTRLPTPLAEDKPTLAKQLKAAGYTTAVFGKMHFNRPAAPGLHGFDSMMTEREVATAWIARGGQKPVPADIRTQALPWRPFRDPARVWLNAGKLPYPRYDQEMKSSFVAELANRFLDEHRQQPFALWVSLTEPHSPFDFPVEDRDAHQAADFTVPPVGPEDAWQIPLIFRGLSDSEKRGIIASYYTSVSFLDRSIGRILGHLRELGLENETFVVYTADHGYSLGQHGRFEKHCGYDAALHVPLIMRLPGSPAATPPPARIQRGRAVHDLSEHVDVTATILDVLGAGPMPIQHGQSLRPYLEGRRPPGPRNHVFSEYLENEEAFIRTARHKFIFCSGKRERGDGYKTENPTPGRYVRLYDLIRDPGELTDLAARHPDIVARLEGLMVERFRKTHPESANEPRGMSTEEAIEWYLRPRDV